MIEISQDNSILRIWNAMVSRKVHLFHVVGFEKQLPWYEGCAGDMPFLLPLPYLPIPPLVSLLPSRSASRIRNFSSFFPLSHFYPVFLPSTSTHHSPPFISPSIWPCPHPLILTRSLKIQERLPFVSNSLLLILELHNNNVIMTKNDHLLI